MEVLRKVGTTLGRIIRKAWQGLSRLEWCVARTEQGSETPSRLDRHPTSNAVSRRQGARFAEMHEKEDGGEATKAQDRRGKED